MVRQGVQSRNDNCYTRYSEIGAGTGASKAMGACLSNEGAFAPCSIYDRWQTSESGRLQKESGDKKLNASLQKPNWEDPSERNKELRRLSEKISP